MESAKNITLVALAVLAAALILPISHASAQDDAWRTWAPEQEVSGVRLHIDNDLFAVRNLDRDYTGGVALTLSGTAAASSAAGVKSPTRRMESV